MAVSRIIDKLRSLSPARMGTYGAAVASVLTVLALASTNVVTIKESFSKIFLSKAPHVGLSLIEIRVSRAGSSSNSMGGERHRPLQFVIEKTTGGTLEGCHVEAFINDIPIRIFKFQSGESWSATPQDEFVIRSDRMLVSAFLSIDMEYKGPAVIRVVCKGYVSDLAEAYIPTYDPTVRE